MSKLWVFIEQVLLLYCSSVQVLPNMKKQLTYNRYCPQTSKTIDEDDLMALSYVMEGDNSEDSCSDMLDSPAVPCTPAPRTPAACKPAPCTPAPRTPASSKIPLVMLSPALISEDVIQTCVTPRKVKGVQSVLQTENVPH